MASAETRPISARLNAGQVLLGFGVRALKTSDVGLIARSAGFDVLVIDREHGAFDAETVERLCAAAAMAGIDALVRLADPRDVGSALEAGADGVVVTGIERAIQARDVVARTLFPPHGRRSASLTRGRVRGESPSALADAQAWNARAFICLVIESEEGMANLDQIAAVPGVSALALGPLDYSLQLGVPHSPPHRLVEEAARRVSQACAAHDLGRAAFSPAPGEDLRGTLVFSGNDLTYLMSGAEAVARHLRPGFVEAPAVRDS